MKNTSSDKPFALSHGLLIYWDWDIAVTMIGTHILFTNWPTPILTAILDCYQLSII